MKELCAHTVHSLLKQRCPQCLKTTLKIAALTAIQSDKRLVGADAPSFSRASGTSTHIEVILVAPT